MLQKKWQENPYFFWSYAELLQSKTQNLFQGTSPPKIPITAITKPPKTAAAFIKLKLKLKTAIEPNALKMLQGFFISSSAHRSDV